MHGNLVVFVIQFDHGSYLLIAHLEDIVINLEIPTVLLIGWWLGFLPFLILWLLGYQILDELLGVLIQIHGGLSLLGSEQWINLPLHQQRNNRTNDCRVIRLLPILLDSDVQWGLLGVLEAHVRIDSIIEQYPYHLFVELLDRVDEEGFAVARFGGDLRMRAGCTRWGACCNSFFRIMADSYLLLSIL